MLLMLSFLKSSYWSKLITANTLRSGKNDRHFGGDIFKYIFMNDKIWTSTFFAEVCCTLGSASVRNGSGLHMRRPITWINADRDMWRQYGVNKLQWMLATKWGREGWSRPPTPGVQPRYPHLIFPPYPRPPFSLIFWGTPAQYSDFLAPVPRPSDIFNDSYYTNKAQLCGWFRYTTMSSNIHKSGFSPNNNIIINIYMIIKMINCDWTIYLRPVQAFCPEGWAFST